MCYVHIGTKIGNHSFVYVLFIHIFFSLSVFLYSHRKKFRTSNTISAYNFLHMLPFPNENILSFFFPLHVPATRTENWNSTQSERKCEQRKNLKSSLRSSCVVVSKFKKSFKSRKADEKEMARGERKTFFATRVHRK